MIKKKKNKTNKKPERPIALFRSVNNIGYKLIYLRGNSRGASNASVQLLLIT